MFVTLKFSYGATIILHAIDQTVVQGAITSTPKKYLPNMQINVIIHGVRKKVSRTSLTSTNIMSDFVLRFNYFYSMQRVTFYWAFTNVSVCFCFTILGREKFQRQK